jgi:RimJ/RimL family protein N-acetyltransferase
MSKSPRRESDARAISGSGERFVVEWRISNATMRIIEPTPLEVRAHAPALAAYYNEPDNRALMTNEHHFRTEDVAVQFAEMRAAGGRPFLLFEDETLMGDCDLRHVEPCKAEFAIMVGARAQQGRGKGTLFSVMALALAFGPLGLKKVYATVRPENVGSLRMFEKVGYTFDATPEARRYAEEHDDVSLSVDARAVAKGVAHRLATESIRVAVR